jgi:hypothetical protein
VEKYKVIQNGKTVEIEVKTADNQGRQLTPIEFIQDNEFNPTVFEQQQNYRAKFKAGLQDLISQNIAFDFLDSLGRDNVIALMGFYPAVSTIGVPHSHAVSQVKRKVAGHKSPDKDVAKIVYQNVETKSYESSIGISRENALYILQMNSNEYDAMIQSLKNEFVALADTIISVTKRAYTNQNTEILDTKGNTHEIDMTCGYQSGKFMFNGIDGNGIGNLVLGYEGDSEDNTRYTSNFFDDEKYQIWEDDGAGGKKLKNNYEVAEVLNLALTDFKEVKDGDGNKISSLRRKAKILMVSDKFESQFRTIVTNETLTDSSNQVRENPLYQYDEDLIVVPNEYFTGDDEFAFVFQSYYSNKDLVKDLSGMRSDSQGLLGEFKTLLAGEGLKRKTAVGLALTAPFFDVVIEHFNQLDGLRWGATSIDKYFSMEIFLDEKQSVAKYVYTGA